MLNWFQKKGKKRSKDEIEKAANTGRNAFLTQQMRAIPILSQEGGSFFDDDKKMEPVELFFMWGWYYAWAEAKKDDDPPISACQNMIFYLVHWHDYAYQDALSEVKDMYDTWNADDPLCEAIRKRGGKSFEEPEYPHLGEVINVLSAHAPRS